MLVSKKPMVLVILDGYGYREEQQDNAIFSAKTPVMDALWANRPHTLIDASGLEVGLPDRQMGNSEVGHVNLGAGRIVYQDLTRLDVEIKDRAFFANPVLTGAVDKAKNAGKAVHIMGLLSAGGVHSHEDHIMAMVELAAERGAEKIYLHAFLDGRDTPPRSAESSLKKFEEKFAALVYSWHCMPEPSTTITGLSLCFSSSPTLLALISLGNRLIEPAIWPLRKSSR